MKKIIVFYHTNQTPCADGSGAAWVAWKKFGNKAEFHAIRAGQTPDQLGKINPKGKDVYFLDVCAMPEKLRELVKNNKSVTVIDHHGTSREKVKYANQWYFDMKHSGAVLTWFYFFPKKPVPWLLRYVEDNDLWKFRLPNSIPLSLRRGLEGDGFKVWERMARNFEKASMRAKYAKEGKLLLDYEETIIRGLMDNAYEVKFKGYLAKVVNTSVAHSVVAHRLIDRKHPIGIVWAESGGTRKFSLRSSGKMDVSKLARQIPGGGGHKHAAGFSMPSNKPFPWKIIKKKGEK